MSILHVWNSRCLRFSSLSYMIHKDPFVTKIPLKTRTLNITSARPISWEGFYTSIALSTPVLTVQDLLLGLHSYSGLPWWAVIGVSTLGIRSVFVFPLAVHQNQVIARLTNLNEELGKMVPELNKEVNIAASMYGWNETRARQVFRKSMKQFHQKFIIRDNCHPFKIILLAIFQIPAWICFSIAIRNLTLFSTEDQVLSQQFKTEGTLWFTNLTVPDMYFIPILLTVVNLLLIEIHALRHIGKGSILQKVLLNVMRAVSLLIGGVAMFNPTSVTFYWLCSSIFGAAQSIMFLSPRFRHFLKIPKMANESATPFKDMALNFRKRLLS